jgi:hypothetical protein
MYKKQRAPGRKFAVDVQLMEQEYKTAKERFSKQNHILAIKECGTEVFQMPDQEKLAAVGIADCTALLYMAKCYDERALGPEEIGGRMIPVRATSGKMAAVILMKNDFSEKYSPPEVAAFKVCFLYHEAGHADDFVKGVNFVHARMECRLKEAEEFADMFAKRRLQHIKCHEPVHGEPSPPTLWDLYDSLRHRGRFVS